MVLYCTYNNDNIGYFSSIEDLRSSAGKPLTLPDSELNVNVDEVSAHSDGPGNLTCIPASRCVTQALSEESSA